MIIARYIAKEILAIFGILTFILLFIAVSNKFVVLLAKAASGKLPFGMVFKVMMLYMPELFVVLAPVAMFVAILFSFSRLYADSEITVLLSCGVGWRYLLQVALAVAGVMALVVGVLSFFVVPEFASKRDELLAQGQIVGMMNAITPGRFQTVEGEDRLVFYVEDIADDGALHNIFLAQQLKQDTDQGTVIITAESAMIKQEQKKNEFLLILRDGYRYSGQPGAADYVITSFKEYGRTLKYNALPVMNSATHKGLKELLHAEQPEEIAEMQWRLGLPVALLLLSLLAVPLSKVQPRQGRYAKFLPAVLVYMVYYNVLTIMRRAIAKGTIASMPGLWVVHFGLLLVCIILLLNLTGIWQEYKAKFTAERIA